MKDLKLKWLTIKDCPAADYQIVSQISNLLIAAASPQNSCFFETTVSILSKVFRVFQRVPCVSSEQTVRTHYSDGNHCTGSSWIQFGESS